MNRTSTELMDHPEEASGISQNTETSESLEQAMVSPQEDFAQLIKKLQDLGLASEHESFLEKAFEYAGLKHAHQKRLSGEPYIHHPIAVCSILSDYFLDPHALVAALLHDTLEDTSATPAEIATEFDAQVADLVEGLTKIHKIRFRSKKEKLAENFRKMILAMSKDLRVVIIKLCDRLHNMRTIEVMDEEKRQRIAQETLDIYAPLANRLGIYAIKSELEDLCLKHLKPGVYEEIAKQVALKKAQRQAEVKQVIAELKESLEGYDFKPLKVTGRSKHFFSIYKKMMLKKISFEEVHDLHGFRVIVSSIKDCYEVLGLIHSMWKPMPGRFNDYIAMPKGNLYQSLHTTVMHSQGFLAEIQIRTEKMHEISELGVASHWHYKESFQGSETDLEKFRWLRQMMEWQKDITDSTEFLEALKVDLFEHEIFVFSPRGDVYRLPHGATPLDFAFAVHSDVGLKARSAKVNQRMISLRQPLANGDIVEILTAPSQRPGKDWLNFVKTSKARSKIRSFFRVEKRESAKNMGKQLLSQALEAKDSSYEKFMRNSSYVEKALSLSRASNLDDLLMGIGFGRTDHKALLDKVLPQSSPPQEHQQELPRIFSEKPSPTHVSSAGSRGSHISVSGIEDVMVTLAKCCHPVPGDEIFGYITRGRGITVHEQSCERGLDLDPARRIAVCWSTGAQGHSHEAHLRVESTERHGLLAEVTSRISASGVNILGAKVQLRQDMLGILLFKVSVNSKKQLSDVISKIESIPGVISVQRSSGGS